MMWEKIYTQISRQKSKVYVVEKNKAWTYEQLETYVAFFNKFFIRNQYKRILLSLHQGFREYSSILATYMTGGTFCVINPELPLERKQYMIQKFNPDLIVGYSSDEIMKSSNIPILPLDHLEEILIQTNDRNIVKAFDNEIAYILFTSGSTGLPKGCKIKRKSIDKFCLWAADEFKISENDIYGQYVPLYFDMSLIDIFGGVLKGATMVPFATASTKLRPGSTIQKYQVTFMNVVPQFLELLIKTGQMKKEFIGTLRMIRFGGDKIYTKRLEQLFEEMPDIEILSTYGPTETTCFCFYQKVNRHNYLEHARDIISIGNTTPDWHAYLRNMEDGIGEIVIYGDYIGAGYVEELGEKRFTTEIINGKVENVYYTGDYARIEHGEYYFEGRRDAQVKINGNRVSLTEVEYSLLELGCQEVATIFLLDNIFAFYITNCEELMDETHIKELLQKKLPAYAVPALSIRLETMPYNANGKVDKKKLKDIAKTYISE